MSTFALLMLLTALMAALTTATPLHSAEDDLLDDPAELLDDSPLPPATGRTGLSAFFPPSSPSRIYYRHYKNFPSPSHYVQQRPGELDAGMKRTQGHQQLGIYSFGLGKRAGPPNHYGFGLGKRSGG